MRRALAAGALVALVVGPARALDPRTEPGQYILRSWGTAHGLPQSSVVALAQTPEGYLWVGTLSGLVRFDGIAFRPLAAAAPVDLGERSVAALAVDGEGALWVGLGGSGVLRWRGGVLAHVGLDAGAPRSLLALAVGPGGRVWTGGWFTGLLGLEAGRFGRVLPEGALPSESLRGLAADPDGTLWVATHGGVARVRGSEVARIAMEGVWIAAVRRDRAGTVWAGGRRGLFRIEGDAAHPVLGAAEGISDVQALLDDRHGNLWIGTSRGLFRWHGGRVVRCDASPALAGGSIRALLEDREGSLWVGVEGGGLTQLKDGALIRIADEQGTPAPVQAVLAAPDGHLWIGTLTAGLARLAEGRLERFGAARDLSSRVGVLALEPDGTLWVAAGYGLRLVTHAGGRFVPRTELPRMPSDVRALIADRTGGVWVGLAGAGVLRASPEGQRWFRAPDELGSDHVFALHQDRTGRVWVGEVHGATWIEQGRRAGAWRHPQDAYVTSFHEDARGDLWIGTGIGLVRYRDGRFRRYLARDGLHAEAIMAVEEDRRGRLWLCSRKGIFHVRKDELDELDRGVRRRVTSVRYAASEGMTALECEGEHGPSATRTPDGRLWFATRAGVAMVDPEAAAPVAAPVLLEGLAVDGTPVEVGAPVVLPPGGHRLLFTFTTPTFLAPEAVAFRYRLEGFDPDWVLAGGARQAAYTLAGPGTYRFRVAAAGEDGEWREAEGPVLLRIRPHPWQTAPFWGAVLLAVAGLGLALQRLRVRQLRARRALLAAERHRLSRELHDNLSARLMGVKLMIDAAARRLGQSPAQAREDLEAARAELPRSLAETRRAIWMLRSEALARGGLVRALEECARQMTAGTDARAEVTAAGGPRPLPEVIEEALLRIAQEAISNAIRHGAARRIDLRLAYEPRRICLVVEDDGRGLPAGGAGEREGHFGLLGMQERARAAGGRVEIGPGAAGGTRVLVEVPLGRAAGLRFRLRRLLLPE